MWSPWPCVACLLLASVLFFLVLRSPSAEISEGQKDGLQQQPQEQIPNMTVQHTPFLLWSRRYLQQQTATLQTATTTQLQEYRDPVLQTRFGHLDVTYFTGVWDVCRAQSSGVVDGYDVQKAWQQTNAFEEVCGRFKEWAGNAFGPFSARVDPDLPEQSYQLHWATSGLYTCNSLHIFSELQAIDAKNQTSNSYFSIVTIPCKVSVVLVLPKLQPSSHPAHHCSLAATSH